MNEYRYFLKKIQNINDNIKTSILEVSNNRTKALMAYSSRIHLSDENTKFIITVIKNKSEETETIIKADFFTLVNELNTINEMIKNGNKIAKEKFDLFSKFAFDFKKVSDVIKHISYQGYLSGTIRDEEINLALVDLKIIKEKEKEEEGGYFNFLK